MTIPYEMRNFLDIGPYSKVKITIFVFKYMKIAKYYIDHSFYRAEDEFSSHLQPNLSVSKVVNLMKGGSSRILRKEFPELEEFLWGDSFWADGYFTESVGAQSFVQIKKYIKENLESMPQKG